MEMRWYGAISDGAFSDLIYELGRVGAACAGEHPARCAWRGARFTLVHDVEGPVRAYIDDPGPLGMGGVWAMLDPILMPATHRTGLDIPPQLAQLGQQAWQEYGPQLQQLGQQLGQQAWQQYGPSSWQTQPATPQQVQQPQVPQVPQAPLPAGRAIGRSAQKSLFQAMPSASSLDLEKFGRGLGRGFQDVLPSIPTVGPSLQRGAREFGQQLGEAGKEIARALPSPSFQFDLEKPTERLAQAMKTVAIIVGVAFVGGMALSALGRSR